MASLRRLTALVTLLVTLVLVLTESGFACSAASGGGDAMAGMSMANVPSHGATGDVPGDAPCRFPWAPNGCRDMAPCAPAALAVAAEPVAPPPTARAPRVAARVQAPASVDTPPELPPPRA